VLKLFYNKGSINDTLEKIDEIAERGRILMGNGWSGISYMAKAEAALITLDYNTAEIFINIAEREYKEPKVRNDGIMLCIAFFNAMLDLSFGKYRTVANEIDFFIDKEKVLESEALKKSAEVCDAWLKSHLGMTGNIADWMKTGDFSNMDLLYHAMPAVYLVHMYVLFSMKKYNKMLSYYELFFGSEPITNNLIVKESAYVLFACAWNEIGKSYNARQCLYEACCMARDTGNLISFVFYGETLIPLLKQVPDEFSELADKIIPQIERFVKNRDKCKKETAGSNMIGLTKREIQIAECAASGMTNREIADELEISENTVKTTLKRIFSKLEISSRRQLALKVKV
jgi:DNA-binding CsgD family transcriptional regulator